MLSPEFSNYAFSSLSDMEVFTPKQLDLKLRLNTRDLAHVCHCIGDVILGSCGNLGQGKTMRVQCISVQSNTILFHMKMVQHYSSGSLKSSKQYTDALSAAVKEPNSLHDTAGSSK